MKRALSLLLTSLLCLSVILTACNNAEEPTEAPTEKSTEAPTEAATEGNNSNGGSTDGGSADGSNADTGNTDGGNTGGDDSGESDGGDGTPAAPVTKTTYTLEKSVMTDSVRTQLNSYFSSENNGQFNGWGYNTGYLPYSFKNDLGFSGSKLTSITIPVQKTTSADSDGNFVFTLYVYKKPTADTAAAWGSVSKVSTYPIKISAAAHGLSNNASNIKKLITVDLTDYNIELKDDETLAFFASSDTLFPMFFAYDNADSTLLREYIKNNFSAMLGFYGKVGNGTENAAVNNESALLFDFTYEKTYDSKEKYEAAVEAAFTENGGKYTLDTPYLEDGAVDIMQGHLTTSAYAGHSYVANMSPFAPTKDLGLSNTKLTSITIPVCSVGDAVDGAYIFTVSVLDKNDLRAENAPIKSYNIRISQKLYGFENGKTYNKLITVDLTDYNIILGANDTLAFGSPGDTLLPLFLYNEANLLNAYVKNHEKLKQFIGFTKNVGGANTPAEDFSNILFFDFTYERSYTSVDDFIKDAEFNVKTVVINSEFDKMLEALKEAYGGLNLSIMGDSISTYKNISNNTAYNTTIGGNAVWYGDGNIAKAGLNGSQDTYWGRLLDATGMKLCVNNAWSGDSLCGGRAFGRATNLHRNTGTSMTPNVIVVYYGINDTWGDGKDVGTLYTLLQNRGEKSADEVVEKWFATVLKKAEAKDFKDAWGESYSSWSEAYALMLYLMSETYSNAKIVLVELTENGSNGNYASSSKWVPQYNACIEALAEYFGMLTVNQQNVINKSNIDQYMQKGDLDADGTTERLIHPNSEGHRVLYEEIVRTLYADLKKNK